MISAPCRYCGTPNALSEQGICDRCNGPNELPAQGGAFDIDRALSSCPVGYFVPTMMPSSSAYNFVCPPIMLESSCPSTLVTTDQVVVGALARFRALWENWRTDG